MTHLTMETLLSLREAGLEPGDASAREHLESCTACRAELDRLHQRVARIKALPALRPGRDRWPPTAARVQAHRRAHRQRVAGLIGLAAAASIAVAVLVGPPAGAGAAAGEQEIQAAMQRSQALESALSQYHPEERMLDGRTAGIAQELEDRIARVDRELEMAELLERQPRDDQLLKLWRERVGLLDALVDVHVTRASNVGL
jgi:Tfp pilus assembly protein PilN